MARYRILPQQSRLEAEARSSLHPIRIMTTGLEGGFDAELQGDRLDPAVKPNAQIEISAALMKTGNRLYDREIERRLDARKFPRIVGRVHALESRGAGRYALDSEVRMHGVAVPVEAVVDVRVVDGGKLEIEGEHVFDVRDFGLEPPQVLMLKVHPEVRVHCLIVAEREE